MKHVLIAIALCSILAPPLAAQNPPPFLAAWENGRVHLLLLDAPGDMAGFTVERKARGGTAFEMLTAEPVASDLDPGSVRRTLGEDYPWVARALRAVDEFELLRRLKSDRGAAAALSLASQGVARVTGRCFVDSAAPAERGCRYRITLLDDGGNPLKRYEWETVPSHPAKPPSRVTCEAGDARVKITWEYPPHSGKPDDLIVGFHIDRESEKGEFIRITPTPLLRQSGPLSRSDLQVENGRTYAYRVRAVDFIGRESAPSAPVSAAPVDRTPPGFPENVQAVAEEGQVLLIWRMNAEQDLSHYDVYRSGNMHDGYAKINREPVPGDRTRFEDRNVIAGPLYYYKLRAVDRSGNASDYSDVAVGHPLDTKPPSPPRNLTATVRNRRVDLRWDAPDDADLQGYYVYQQIFDGSFMRIHPDLVQKKSPSYQDAGFTRTGVPVGKTYVYGVTAVDNSWLESPRVEVRILVPDDEPPDPPFDWFAHPTQDGGVRIGWQPSSSLDVVAYRIYRSEEGGRAVLLREASGGFFAMEDKAVAEGRAYAYQVSAVDSSGNESVRTPPKKVVPRDLSAPDAPLDVAAAAAGKKVTITWASVPAEDLAGYNVYRSELPNTAETKLNRSPINETRFIDSKGRKGWYYRVSSLDRSGHENRGGAPVEAR